MSDFFNEDSTVETRKLVIDAAAVRGLYFRDTTKGASNRRLLKSTLPVTTYNAFVRFLNTYAGAGIHKGNGIGSPMVAVALKLMMAMFAKYRIDDAVTDIRDITLAEHRPAVAANLQELAQKIT